jgi:hypothetical protein
MRRRGEFLTQRVSLFRLYDQPGNTEVVEREDGRGGRGRDADRLACPREAL